MIGEQDGPERSVQATPLEPPKSADDLADVLGQIVASERLDQVRGVIDDDREYASLIFTRGPRLMMSA